MKNYRLINKQQIEDPDFDWVEYLDTTSVEDEEALINALTKEELSQREDKIIEVALELNDWDDYEIGDEVDWPTHEYYEWIKFNCGWAVTGYGYCTVAGDDFCDKCIEEHSADWWGHIN